MGEREVEKECRRHGSLSKSAFYPDGRCRQCRKEDNHRYSKRRKAKRKVKGKSND
jgi:hypothetical protein